MGHRVAYILDISKKEVLLMETRIHLLFPHYVLYPFSD